MDLQTILIAVTEAAQTAAEVSETVAPAAHVPEESLVGTLGINWKLFLAQLVNFGIVLYVFWRWMVKPLGNTLTKRQERIEEGLKNATLMDEEKKKFEEWKLAEMKKVRIEADQVLRVTTDSANKLKQETIVEAQKQSEKMIKQAEVAIQSEKDQMLKEAKQELSTLVVMASEKILRAKLDPKKDHELINESLKK